MIRELDARRSADAKIEKPAFVYHGSITPNIQEFEPRERYKPQEGVGARIYATDLPAFAAAHSFPWHSAEGFDLSLVEEKVVFTVPNVHKDRLNALVYIYKLPSDTFNWTAEEKTGHTFDSREQVKPISIENFNSVTEAIQHFGGEVVFLD